MMLLILIYIYLLYGAYLVGYWYEIPEAKKQITELKQIPSHIGKVFLIVFTVLLIVFWPIPLVYAYIAPKK